MRSSNDPITGLKNNILEWGVVEESALKAIDKEARHEVEVAVEEAKKSPEPSQETDMYTDSASPLPSPAREAWLIVPTHCSLLQGYQPHVHART